MWPSPQFPMDFVTFSEETVDRKLHFYAIFIRRYIWNGELQVNMFIRKHIWDGELLSQ